MNGHFRCITNNPMVVEQKVPNLEYYETDVLGLLNVVFQEIKQGYRLLSHPLTGSIRPDITPYKTVLLSFKEEPIDMESIKLIERAISYAKDLYKLRDVPIYKKWGEEARKDFQCVDFSMIEQALEVGDL